jgi:hypothetical protein
MTSKDLYLRIACNDRRCRTARHGYFRILIRHEVLVDWGHLRIRCHGVLCHRLVHRTEHHKQCECFDRDCAIFWTLFASLEWAFSGRPPWIANTVVAAAAI